MQEVPEESKKKKKLYKTEVFRFDSGTTIMLTLYQSKSKKNMAILSSLHPDVQISINENPKKKPSSTL